MMSLKLMTMSNWIGGTAGAILDPIVGISTFLILSYITLRWGLQIQQAIVKSALVFTLIFCPLFVFAPFLLVSPLWLLAPVGLILFGFVMIAELF